MKEKKYYKGIYKSYYWVVFCYFIFFNYIMVEDGSNFFTVDWVITIAVIAYQVYMIIMIHKSFKEIKINYGWIYGLSALLPIAYLIFYFYAKHKFVKADMWEEKETT